MSRTVIRPEAEIGTPLFERQGRRIRLDAHGTAFPAEAEELLPGHRAVAQCPVFGSRDGESVEPMHTAVVPAAGQRPTLDGIRDSVTTREGRPCAPDALRLVPAIPLTAAGRPDKRLPRSRLSD